MLAPMLVGFFTFTYFPILYILKYSVYQWDGFKGNFNGIENFVRIFTRDWAFWESLLNTLVLSAGKLMIEIPLALLLAVLLHRGLKGSSVFRVLLFLPTIISTAIIGLVFSLMFAAYNGVINSMLMDIGLIARPIGWFSQKWSAMFVLGLASIWSYIGINVIFFLMALQSVPKELHECASLDGATGLRKFWNVTLPMIGPIFRIVLLNAIIGSLKVNELVLASTNGQPSGKTEVVMTYVFKFFFGYSGRKVEVGYASAMALVTALFLGMITVVYLRTSRKMEGE
jgi:ABC-type sugar transport system permease subunit